MFKKLIDSEVPPEQEKPQEKNEEKEENKEEEKDKDKEESKQDKKNQKLIADLKRCRIQMANAKRSIQKPTV